MQSPGLRLGPDLTPMPAFYFEATGGERKLRRPTSLVAPSCRAIVRRRRKLIAKADVEVFVWTCPASRNGTLPIRTGTAGKTHETLSTIGLARVVRLQRPLSGTPGGKKTPWTTRLAVALN